MENITHELYLKQVATDLLITPPSVEYPNVVTIQSSITAKRTLTSTDEFMMVDLALKSFSPLSEEEVKQGYWQTFARFVDAIHDAIGSAGVDLRDVSSVLMEYLGGSEEPVCLTMYHDICNTFTDDYIPTDSLFTLNTRPFGNAEADFWQVEVYRLDTDKSELYLWSTIPTPKLVPKSGLPPGCLRQFYECRLGHGRFLMIYPCGSDIADLVLGLNSHIYMLQKIPMLVNYNQSSVYALVQINISGNASKAVKLTVTEGKGSTTMASITHKKFRLICCGDFILGWHFNSAGAFGDVFFVHVWNDEKRRSSEKIRKLENKLFRIQNSRSFSAYNFEDKQRIRDFVRDLPSIVTLRSKEAFFAGASMLSVFDELAVENIHVDPAARQVPAFTSMMGVMATQAFLPVHHVRCDVQKGQPAGKMNFIGDFAAFRGEKIFVRWVDMIGQDKWGVWERKKSTFQPEWEMVRSESFNSESWNKSLSPCYVWNERWKTIVTIVEASKLF